MKTLKKEIDRLKQYEPEPIIEEKSKDISSISIDDLKNMSYWEFRKWRKS